MLPNSVQAQTSGAAIVAGLAGYAAGQHWLGIGVDGWSTIFGGIAGIALVLWPVVSTRLQALKTTVGNSGALVVTNAESAAASPSPNVVTPAQVAMPARSLAPVSGPVVDLTKAQ